MSPTPDRPRKLTMRRIREICSNKVFNLGKEIYNWDLVMDVDLKQDGTLSGMMIEDWEYFSMLRRMYRWEKDKPESDKVHRITVSLQTGKWQCTCPYARVDVCSHVAALLIYASKDLGATVPAGDLPMQNRPKPSIVPYRDETLRILAEADSIESADKRLTDLLELATSCREEEDYTEALMVYMGLTEALLYGLDYQAYYEHFTMALDLNLVRSPEDMPEPESMDELRVYKFAVAAYWMKYLMYSGLKYELKTFCLSTMHRMFVLTNPWAPSRFYLYLLLVVPRTDRYHEFMRRLHDPLVPKHTPDWRENPVEFRATLNLAYYQSRLYQMLKDPSLLDFYKKHYRDDVGMCIRYGQYLAFNRRGNTPTTRDRCRRLFPYDDPWESDSVEGLPGIEYEWWKSTFYN